MSQDNSTDETLPGGAQLTPADGGAAVAPDTMTLADLNTLLGKDFKDKDSALKAVQDTFKYVGKRKEDIEAEVRSTLTPTKDSPSALETDVQALKTRLFYSENPQYRGYESLIARMGGDPAEVVASEDFKTVFAKVTVADEVAQSKSVVHSSPRLAQAKSTTDEAVQIANARGSTNEDVAATLARGILADEAQA